MAGELWQHSARGLAAMIANRETSSRTVIEAHLDRIAAVNAKVNAVVLVLAESARAAAEAIEARLGRLTPIDPR